jgi:hypothetical protein
MPRASSLRAMAKSAGPLGTWDGSAEAVRTLDASPFMPRPYRPLKRQDIDSHSPALASHPGWADQRGLSSIQPDPWRVLAGIGRDGQHACLAERLSDAMGPAAETSRSHGGVARWG